MSKPEITVVLPSLHTPLEEITAYQAFLKSEIREKLYVQFVFLRNGFHNSSKEKATITKHDTHEVLFVPHDRLFHTAEENLYRVQDFMELLKPRLFVIGNDDELDWVLFYDALAFFDKNRLDALGLQVMFKQFYNETTHGSLPLLTPIGAQTKSRGYVQRFLEGEVMDSAEAYGAVMSICGAVWWPTYFGNHIYSRETFARILQYRFSEPICSHLFMHIECFSKYRLRYAFFDQPVVSRLGYEFMHQHRKTQQEGGVTNHRTALGHSKVQNVVYLAGLGQLQDDVTFNVTIHGVGTKIASTGYCEMGHATYAALAECLSWSQDVMREKIQGKSHYFPEAKSSCLHDLRYVQIFLERLVRCMEKFPSTYQHLPAELREHICNAAASIQEYLMSMSPNELLLLDAHNRLRFAQNGLTLAHVVGMNQASFDTYMTQLQEKSSVRSTQRQAA